MTHESNLILERWGSTATLCPVADMTSAVAKISHRAKRILATVKECVGCHMNPLSCF